jgi:NAD-dependent deacetylase sirtuin 4
MLQAAALQRWQLFPLSCPTSGLPAHVPATRPGYSCPRAPVVVQCVQSRPAGPACAGPVTVLSFQSFKQAVFSLVQAGACVAQRCVWGNTFADIRMAAIPSRAAATATVRLRSLAPVSDAVVPLEHLGPSGGALLALFTRHRRPHRVAILTGAGCSTESGVPDYRSPGRPPYRPLQHNEYISQEGTRRRYWARSFVGYPRMAHAQPNGGHLALAALQCRGWAGHHLTQNVDRLAHRGLAVQRKGKDSGPDVHWPTLPMLGSSPGEVERDGDAEAAAAAVQPGILEVHGTIHEVHCMRCAATQPRNHLQQRMAAENAAWLEAWAAAAAPRPDGDVELPVEAYATFGVPHCEVCGGTLKPSVVFHGGCVPQPVSEAALRIVNEADALLCLGTTLTVWSSFRLARAAAAAGKPLGIINFGPTRADDLATFKIEASVTGVLTALLAALPPSHPALASGQ